ncbi:MAG: hypothetical protein KTR22_05480 [Flavobacteriaceae bacterium]|nr:hypothetical protein [Flavobacteriaceae bacterium]
MANYTFQEAIDPRFIRHLRPEFELNNQTSNEAKLIRLLLGTVIVTNNYSTDSFDQFKNYSELGISENLTVSTKPIRECLLPNGDLTVLCSYIDKSKNSNNSYFLHLLEEITSFFYKKNKGSHTTAFLHLYRSIEYISYSFPLIYASVSREYYGSFNKIKNYFDTSKSELLFFDEFTLKILDDGLLDTPLTFNFNTLSQDINRNHFQIIKHILTAERIDNEVPNVSITTTYKHLLKLAIDLRNRYFHFALGGKRNIRGTEIIENDVFFSIINDDLLNWVSMIYFEILLVSAVKV